MGNLIDSSVWVALFLDFDTQHAKAKRLFSGLKGTLYLSACVAHEVITILAYKHSKKQADQFISFLESSGDIEYIDGDIVEEMRFYQRINARISCTDAALLFHAKTLKLNLVTFDKQLKGLLARGR